MKDDNNGDAHIFHQLITYFQFSCHLLFVIAYSIFCYLLEILKIILPKTPKSLNGETILVTGGANGIGREICFEIAKREKNVTIISWDLNQDKNAELIDQLKDFGVKHAFAFTIDVSDRKQVATVAKKIRETIGDVTILINNAGIAPQLRLGWQQDPENVERVFQINFLSHCWTLREFLPYMINNRKGHIVEICSILGFLYGSGGASYTASKHAIVGYIESIKEDLRQLRADTNIPISLVYPSFTRTSLINDVHIHARYDFTLKLLTPSNVAKKIVSGMVLDKEHIYIPKGYFWIQILMACIPQAAVRMFIDTFQMNTQLNDDKNK